MRKEGKGGVTFDSDEALLASPANELVNSGILGGAKKTKIVLTNANVGSQPMTLDGETYGSYREITSPLPESRHLHSTHHTTMYGGSQVPFRASPRSSHDSPAGGSHPGSRRGSHYSPEAFVVPIHGNSGSSGNSAQSLFGSRASRGSFLGNFDNSNDDDEGIITTTHPRPHTLNIPFFLTPHSHHLTPLAPFHFYLGINLSQLACISKMCMWWTLPIHAYHLTPSHTI